MEDLSFEFSSSSARRAPSPSFPREYCILCKKCPTIQSTPFLLKSEIVKIRLQKTNMKNNKPEWAIRCVPHGHCRFQQLFFMLRMDRRTKRGTDRASFKDARTHLRINSLLVFFFNSAVGVFYADYGIQDFFSFVLSPQKRYRTKNPFQFNLLFPSPATDFLIYIHKNPSQGSSAAGNGSA